MPPNPLFFKTPIVSTGLVFLLLGMGSLTHAQTDGSAYVSMINGWKADGSNLKGGQSNQYGFSYPDTYTSYSTVKVYVPAGTTDFAVLGSLPQETPYAVVARFGQPPTRTTPIGGSIGTGEYGNINSMFTSQTKAFAQLLAGQEMIQVHNGGGSVGYAGAARLTGRPLLKGQWLYIRVLNDSYNGVYGFQGSGTVDLTMYRERMASVVFQSDGVPREELILPERPTGIVLQPSTVAAGGSAAIQPDKPNAIALGRCAADTTNPIARHLSIQNYKITVAATAPAGVVKISCGDATDFSSDSAFATPVFHADLTIGTPAHLQGLALSANYINITNPAPITINPFPDNASIGSCSLSGAGAGLATVSGSTITLKSGASVTTPTSTTVTCSGQAANFTIQPPPSLTLAPSTLSQASNTSVSVRKSDGTSASSCQFSSTSSGFDPNKYLDWINYTIKFKTAAPTLTQKQTVSVTCDGSQSATLTLDPAPVGRLYPEKDSTDRRKMLLRWQEADANGRVTTYSLAGKYPSYPTATSNTKFVCSEIDAQGASMTPSNFSFTAATDPYLTLTTTLSTPLKTKIRCTVMTTGFPSTELAGSTKDLPLINITDNTWDIAQPTPTTPVMDTSDAASAKFQLYIPRATTSPIADIPIVVVAYIPQGNPYAGSSAVFTPSGLKLLNGTETEQELVYTTVSGFADRVVSVDSGFPKSVLAGLKIKIAVFYKDGWFWKSLTTPETEWDSTK